VLDHGSWSEFHFYDKPTPRPLEIRFVNLSAFITTKAKCGAEKKQPCCSRKILRVITELTGLRCEPILAILEWREGPHPHDDESPISGLMNLRGENKMVTLREVLAPAGNEGVAVGLCLFCD
jgi:hypothetical protein